MATGKDELRTESTVKCSVTILSQPEILVNVSL